MLVLSMDWESVSSAVAAVGTVGAVGAVGGVATAFISQRSTDRAEARYRTDLVQEFETALGNDGSYETPAIDDGLPSDRPPTESGSLVPDTPKGRLPEPANATTENDPQHRMAALPVQYHAQVLAQSRASFFFSVGAAVVGFIILAVAIAVVLSGSVAPGLATMVAAAITEAVPALFFTQSNRARKVMAEQLDGFRLDAETARAAQERRELIEMVGDPSSRDALITNTVLKLPERHPAPLPGGEGTAL